MTYSLDSVTIVIKTFKRPQALLTLLRSIRAMYPGLAILVADDSEPQEVARLGETLRDFDRLSYYELPFDSGLSAGRNFLVSKVNTDLVMVLDDDTVFGEHTCIEYAIEVFNRFPFLDLIAGWYEPELFYGSQVVEDGRLIRDQQRCREIYRGCPLFDFVANMFVARTRSVASVLWDAELKIQEHMDFFWRARGRLRVTHLPYFRAFNSHAREATDYEDYRGRYAHFQQMQASKIGVSAIVDRHNEPLYLQDSIDPIFVRPQRVSGSATTVEAVV